MRCLLTGLILSAAAIAPAWAGPVEDYEVLREEAWERWPENTPTLATRVGDRWTAAHRLRS